MNEGQPYEAPAVVVLSRWDYERNVPVVFPSRRDGAGNHAVLLTEMDIAREVAKYEALKTLTTIPYRIDVVPPGEAQAFIDARAEKLVGLQREASRDVGPLRVYGFTDAQLAELGYEQKGETL